MRLIDALKVINEIERFKGYLDDDIILRIKIAINRLPTIDAEPVRHGHWVVDEDGNIKCSECGHHSVGDNYCERCGAKMNEVKDNE